MVVVFVFVVYSINVHYFSEVLCSYTVFVLLYIAVDVILLLWFICSKALIIRFLKLIRE